jgi:sugar phosphate isomerase/epimerase
MFQNDEFRSQGKGVASLLILSGAAVLVGNNRLFGTPWIDSTVRGVQIGATSYCFRPWALRAVIKGYQAVGLGECELWQAQVEPQRVSREQLRKWRLSVPLDHFRQVRRQFDRARVFLYAYNYSFQENFTGAEIERGFQMARALNVKYITASSPLSVVHKVDAYAERYKIVVGFHNHDATSDPDQFSNAASFERGLKGTSRWVAINLDIGHFVAANSDPVSFLRKHHSRIIAIHVKDRKRNHGPDVPFGQGDTPIVPVLRLLRDNHWKIPAEIEYEYGPKPRLDTIAEMKKCYEYCRKALLTNAPNGPAPVRV